MRYISFGHYHFRLALLTHCQIHQNFLHGSDQSSFLQCQGFENVWSNHPSLLKWSNPGCILFVSGQVCSCLMIRRTSQRMSLVPSLFFCLLWLLCLLICISSIYLCNVFGSLWFIYLHEAQVYSFWLSMKKLCTMYMANLHISSPLYLHS